MYTPTMAIQHFTTRALTTLRKLALHDVSQWVLVGGLAVEFHRPHNGPIRPLNDIDFVAAGFDCIPHTLAQDFLFRHIHPFDPPGKTMMQLVDGATALRVDLFRTHTAIVRRASPVNLPSGPLQIISLEDAVAHAARLLLDLQAGLPVPAKHARDYLRLAQFVESSSIETAWQDHRKPTHPATFRETNTLLNRLIATHGDLLIKPEYSKDATGICPRCVGTPPFHLADPNLVLSLLGYC